MKLTPLQTLIMGAAASGINVIPGLDEYFERKVKVKDEELSARLIAAADEKRKRKQQKRLRNGN